MGSAGKAGRGETEKGASKETGEQEEAGGGSSHAALLRSSPQRGQSGDPSVTGGGAGQGLKRFGLNFPKSNSTSAVR